MTIGTTPHGHGDPMFTRSTPQQGHGDPSSMGRTPHGHGVPTMSMGRTPQGHGIPMSRCCQVLMKYSQSLTARLHTHTDIMFVLVVVPSSGSVWVYIMFPSLWGHTPQRRGVPPLWVYTPIMGGIPHGGITIMWVSPHYVDSPWSITSGEKNKT
jgi:hypothetical protein